MRDYTLFFFNRSVFNVLFLISDILPRRFAMGVSFWTLIAGLLVLATAASDRERLETAQQILAEVPLIDG